MADFQVFGKFSIGKSNSCKKIKIFLDKWIFCQKIKFCQKFLGGRLKCMIAGGAPVDVKTQQFMSICMSCPLVIGYGLTETCAGGSVQVKNGII